jgi:hypothetical protein
MSPRPPDAYSVRQADMRFNCAAALYIFHGFASFSTFFHLSRAALSVGTSAGVSRPTVRVVEYSFARP